MAKLNGVNLTQLHHQMDVVGKLWETMCITDGVSIHDKFVVFSKTNPFSKDYNQAVLTLFEIKTQLDSSVNKLLLELAQTPRNSNLCQQYANNVYIQTMKHASKIAIEEADFNALFGLYEQEAS